jgi:amino acid adenylation domain-containing protein/non-ribosomal peptide synthase protein (TIGR01720 family)
MENGGALPEESVLESIAGIAFAPTTAGASWDVLAADLLEDELEKRPAGNPEHLNSSSDMAYIIYTSGSTGIPKGVIIEHRNVVNVLEWFARTYNLQPDTHVIQLNNVTFDPSVEQLFGTLLHGASVYMGGKELVADKEAVARFVKENQIHVFNFVPSGLKEMLGENERMESVRVVISGAEKLEDSLKSNLLEKGYALYNHYGPTETTIEALTERCSGDPVTLGRPIANTQCHILLSGDAPAPIGVTGELCIAGAGVSRGYLNNPELTAERFIDSRETKLYKTGDLARRLPDGRVEFLGRIDHQVKIRGLRIELGEIEYQLQRHSKIKDAVVIALKRQSADAAGEAPSEDTLCAYIVPKSPIAESELREYLIMELPPYMIPDFFVTLDKMPLTSNGKVDRKALPEPWGNETDPVARYAPPTNEMEEILVDIWQGVLGKEKIGIDDNFFTSGGDSVKSIQILSRLKKVGYKVEMTEIFRYPTIAQLAPLLKKAEREADQSEVRGTMALTPEQTDFFKRHKTAPHLFNRAAMLHFREGLDEAALREIFTRLQGHHDALRITFGHEGDGTIVQTGHGEDMPLALDVFDLRGRENAAEILDQKAGLIRQNIDLENGPLMKLGLFHMDDGDRLCLAIHTLAADHDSWRILLEDIDSLYLQYNENKRGGALELPQKTDSFKLWTETLTRYAVGNPLLEEKNWWRAQEDITVAPLSPDEKLAADGEDVRCVSFTLDESQTGKLLTRANDAFGTDVNDILLTALGLALKETFESDRYLVALEGSGRDNPLESLQLKRTVGSFTYRFPAILDLSYAQDKSRQLVEIKDYLRRFPNNGLDYGILKSLTPSDLQVDIAFTHQAQIGFNPLYLPEENAGEKSFDVTFESPSQTFCRPIPLDFPVEVTPRITGNRLSVFGVYDADRYQAGIIETLVVQYETSLKQLIEFCLSREAEELTPGDMDYKELSVEEMDSIFD